MASEHQVRQYLAYWFQLGSKVFIHNGKTALLPRPVIEGDRYSQAFEECWAKIQAPDAGDCYLDGSTLTIAELLTPKWELLPCARCSMPVAMPGSGITDLSCPCAGVPNWPDLESPMPRAPISNQAQLVQIRDRLLRAAHRAQTTIEIHPDASNQSQAS